MSQTGVYGESKMLWWYVRERGLPEAPKQVQLILSDLCNQDCVGAGTMVDCPGGARPIEALSPGDRIIGADGREATVESTAWKVSEDLYEVKAGPVALHLTGQHKLLTQEGWKRVRELSEGDSAVLRMRVRPEDAVESEEEDVGRVHIQTPEIRKEDGLRGESGVSAPDTLTGTPGVSVRLQETSEAPHAWSRSLLGGLSVWSSECREEGPHVSRGQGQNVPKDEVGQPHATAWSRRTGETLYVQGNLALKSGTEIRCVCDLAQTPGDIHRRRLIVGEQAEPGLPGAGPEKGYRDNHPRHLQRRGHYPKNGGRVRQKDREALRKEPVDVSGGVLPGRPPKASEGDDAAGHPRLLLEGIKLERGVAFRKIDSIRKIKGRFKVYDISCPPARAFFAGGLVVSNCHFCAYRISGNPSNELFMGDSEAAKTGTNNPKRRIPTDRALRFLDEFKELGVLSVQFTGGGEPTAHPDHERIFSRALDLGLRCSLVSNGVNWSYSLIKEVLPRFDWVRVSVDAGDPDTYVTTRRCPPKHWDAAWEHIRTLGAAIRSCESPCVFGLGFVVTPESYHEIPAFTALAKAAGVSNVRYTAMFSKDGASPYKDIYGDVTRLIGGARRVHESGRFKVYDNFGSRVADLEQQSPSYKPCSYQHYTTYIGGDCHAYRCCILAYNQMGRSPGSDLSERSFADYWRSEERKKDFADLDARKCPRCQFNTKNQQMLYVIGNTASDTSPRHIEWP